MISNRLTQFFFVILFFGVLMAAACGDHTGTGTPENPGSKPAKKSALYSDKDQSKDEPAATDVNWGREINLDEMIAMARKGRIVEIQWHVMPNILRAEAVDGEVFHIKNENKGVDLRSKLINAGVRVGEGGIPFKYFF